MQPMPLTEEEKAEFYDMFNILSFDILKKIYYRVHGSEFEGRKKSELIDALLNSEWDEKAKTTIREYFRDLIELSKPKSCYILPLKIEDWYTPDNAREFIKNNLYSYTGEQAQEGFELVDFTGDTIKFKYWYFYSRGIFTDDGEYIRIRYPTSILFTLDASKSKLYIETSSPQKFLKARSIIQKEANNLGFQVLSVYDEDEIDDPQEYSEEINEKFKQFIDDVRNQLINTLGRSQSSATEVFRITDVIIDVTDVAGEGMEELLKIGVIGSTDIFNNKKVREYLEKGGRLVGLYGDFDYKLDTYRFVVKHFVGYAGHKPAYLAVRRKRKIIESKEFKEDLEEAFKILQEIFEKYFL